MLHCKQLRSHTAPTPDKEDVDLASLDSKDAKKLANQCWKACFLFQSWICKGSPPHVISQEFDEWWLGEGESMLSKKRSLFTAAEQQEDEQEWEEHLEDMVEAMDGDCGEIGEGGEEADSSKLDSLVASEDHLKAKRQLQELTEAMGKEEPIAEPLPLPSSETVDQADVAVIADLVKETMQEPTLFTVMKPLLDCPAFEVRATEGNAAVLQRMTALRPEIRKLVLAMRLRERFLSHACLTGTSKTQSSWHSEQHRLAVARARSLISGARNSRQQSWWQVQQQVTGTSLTETVQTDWKLRPLTVLRPPEPGNGQAPNDISNNPCAHMCPYFLT